MLRKAKAVPSHGSDGLHDSCIVVQGFTHTLQEEESQGAILDRLRSDSTQAARAKL